MAAKELKNLIIAVVIAIVGVQLLLRLAKGYIPQSPLVPKDILLSIDALANLITLGLIVILLFALPFYFSKRGEEKKPERIP